MSVLFEKAGKGTTQSPLSVVVASGLLAGLALSSVPDWLYCSVEFGTHSVCVCVRPARDSRGKLFPSPGSPCPGNAGLVKVQHHIPSGCHVRGVAPLPAISRLS